MVIPSGDVLAPPPATVLVVDDNEANRLLAQATLEDEGYAVVLASGGLEGVERFRTQPVDCVLLDVRMPDLDGFAACEQIRALPGGREAPVLFLTALRDVDTFDRALRAGGDDFLTKPVRPTELVVRVQSALKLRRMRTELSEHYELLKRQRDDVMRLQLQKERLTAFIVHDLKAPVHSLELLVHVMLDECSDNLQAVSWLRQMRTTTQKLDRMIRDLLDLAKSDEGGLVPQPTEVVLADLVTSVIQEQEVVASLKNVTLAADLHVPTVHADPELLRRTVANLVENAIRHSPRGTEVTIASRSEASDTVVTVADRGSGVPASLRATLFDPFVRGPADDAPASRRGYGLGLAFCRMAVEAHGGSMSLDGEAPGAVFRLRLPAARSSTTTPPSWSGPSANPSS
jgi:two-component system sensor histidine kinase/response regulator